MGTAITSKTCILRLEPENADWVMSHVSCLASLLPAVAGAKMGFTSTIPKAWENHKETTADQSETMGFIMKRHVVFIIILVDICDVIFMKFPNYVVFVMKLCGKSSIPRDKPSTRSIRSIRSRLGLLLVNLFNGPAFPSCQLPSRKHP